MSSRAKVCSTPSSERDVLGAAADDMDVEGVVAGVEGADVAVGGRAEPVDPLIASAIAWFIAVMARSAEPVVRGLAGLAGVAARR